MGNGKEVEKFALVGAACVGKTTLLNDLREASSQRPDVVFLDEVARDFFQQNPTDPSEVFSLGIQSRLQDLILEREQQAHALKPTFIICDRSVLDSPVHLKAMGDEEGANKLLERVHFWLPTYNCFFLLDPKDILYEQDKIRRESEETRNSIHQAFIDFFQQHGSIPFRVLSGSLEERLRLLQGILAGNESVREST